MFLESRSENCFLDRDAMGVITAMVAKCPRVDFQRLSLTKARTRQYPFDLSSCSHVEKKMCFHFVILSEHEVSFSKAIVIEDPFGYRKKMSK